MTEHPVEMVQYGNAILHLILWISCFGKPVRIECICRNTYYRIQPSDYDKISFLSVIYIPAEMQDVVETQGDKCDD